MVISMKYDFERVVDRRNTCSLKWDVKEGELPMWVADMDFPVAPEIKRAIAARVEHGVFGYSVIPEEWGKAYARWWERRHSFAFDPSHLIFCTGVVPAISSIVRKLTTPNENVVLQTPVYNIFFNSVVNNGARVLESPLRYDGREYSVDFEDLEQKLADPQTTLMILCNPHNPVGKIWDRATLEKIGELCYAHHVTVISDEIHCDLTEPGKEYVPFASVSAHCREVSITCLAPTKSFNLAGLQTAAVLVPDDFLRHKVWRGLNTDEVAEPNAFAVCAAIAAFEEGEAWLEALRSVISENKKTVQSFVQANIPAMKVVPSEATYLLWLDCSAFTEDSEALAKTIREKTGLYLSDGAQFGGDGRHFLRFNVACPKTTLLDGLNRLKAALSPQKL